MLQISQITYILGGITFCVLMYFEAVKRQVPSVFQIVSESDLSLNRFIVLVNWSNLESLATFSATGLNQNFLKM